MRGVLQVYLAEKIYDCLWWIMRFEEQKRAVTLACMAEIATKHLLVRDARNEREFCDVLDLIVNAFFESALEHNFC